MKTEGGHLVHRKAVGGNGMLEGRRQQEYVKLMTDGGCLIDRFNKVQVCVYHSRLSLDEINQIQEDTFLLRRRLLLFFFILSEHIYKMIQKLSELPRR